MLPIYTTVKNGFQQLIETLDPARFTAMYNDDDVAWLENVLKL